MPGSARIGQPPKAGRAARREAKESRRLVPRPIVPHPGDAPDFLCVGAHKGGTRWLYDQLQLHPDFWMPPVKELHYLDHRRPPETALSLKRRADKDLERTNEHRAKIALRPLDQRDVDFLAAFVGMTWWRTDFDAYASLFSLKGDLISGDITPDYSRLSERTIARLMRRLPKTKVIFIARDPVERVWSHVTMRMGRGQIDRGIDADGVMRLVRQRFVATRSYPSEIVARWRRYVPQDSSASSCSTTSPPNRTSSGDASSPSSAPIQRRKAGLSPPPSTARKMATSSLSRRRSGIGSRAILPVNCGPRVRFSAVRQRAGRPSTGCEAGWES